jgi:biotin transport system substrate-specific component
MLYPTYADLARPAWKPLGLLYDFLLVSGASLLIAVSGQIAIPLPFTPVPLTLQTLVVLAAGVVLGSSRGALAVTLYLLEGCAGLPVFSGAASGITHLLGPTGGYLLGFLPAAWLTGVLAEKGWDRRLLSTLVAMLAGNALIYLPGVAWLARFVGAERAMQLGFLPFIPGDLLKTAIAVGLLPAIWRLLPCPPGACNRRW